MMTKEQFVKRIKLIQNFYSEQDTLAVLINKITGGGSIVIIGDYLVQEIIAMIYENMKCNPCHGWIEWWLWEDVEKVVYYPNGTQTKVETLEELYEFLVAKEY